MNAKNTNTSNKTVDICGGVKPIKINIPEKKVRKAMGLDDKKKK